DLARELGVSERHLRRALERELGVSPVALAQTHRLLLAKRLLADTALPVTHIAYASGFQSLRRFNSVFRAKYRQSPSALRRGHPPRAATSNSVGVGTNVATSANDLVRLTLAYRPPIAWSALVEYLAQDAVQGMEVVQGSRYGRTVSLGGRRGLVFVENA